MARCGDGSAAIDLVSFESQFPDTDGVREQGKSAGRTMAIAATNVSPGTTDRVTGIIWR